MSTQVPGNREALDRAVACFENGRQGLADAVGVSLMSVTHWYRRGLSIERAKDISRVTRRLRYPVGLADLRPDFFDDMTKAA